MMYGRYDVYKFSFGLLFIVHVCFFNFLVIFFYFLFVCYID